MESSRDHVAVLVVEVHAVDIPLSTAKLSPFVDSINFAALGTQVVRIDSFPRTVYFKDESLSLCTGCGQIYRRSSSRFAVFQLSNRFLNHGTGQVVGVTLVGDDNLDIVQIHTCHHRTEGDLGRSICILDDERVFVERKRSVFGRTQRNRGVTIDRTVASNRNRELRRHHTPTVIAVSFGNTAGFERYGNIAGVIIKSGERISERTCTTILIHTGKHTVVFIPQAVSISHSGVATFCQQTGSATLIAVKHVVVGEAVVVVAASPTTKISIVHGATAADIGAIIAAAYAAGPIHCSRNPREVLVQYDVTNFPVVFRSRLTEIFERERSQIEVSDRVAQNIRLYTRSKRTLDSFFLERVAVTIYGNNQHVARFQIKWYDTNRYSNAAFGQLQASRTHIYRNRRTRRCRARINEFGEISCLCSSLRYFQEVYRGIAAVCQGNGSFHRGGVELLDRDLADFSRTGQIQHQDCSRVGKFQISCSLISLQRCRCYHEVRAAGTVSLRREVGQGETVLKRFLETCVVV